MKTAMTLGFAIVVCLMMSYPTSSQVTTTQIETVVIAYSIVPLGSNLTLNKLSRLIIVEPKSAIDSSYRTAKFLAVLVNLDDESFDSLIKKAEKLEPLILDIARAEACDQNFDAYFYYEKVETESGIAEKVQRLKWVSDPYEELKGSDEKVPCFIGRVIE